MILKLLSRFLVIIFLASITLLAYGAWEQDCRWEGSLYAGARKLKKGNNYETEAKGECVMDHVCGDYDLKTYVGNFTDPDTGHLISHFYGNFSETASTGKKGSVKKYGANSRVSGTYVKYGDYFSANASI